MNLRNNLLDDSIFDALQLDPNSTKKSLSDSLADLDIQLPTDEYDKQMIQVFKDFAGYYETTPTAHVLLNKIKQSLPQTLSKLYCDAYAVPIIFDQVKGIAESIRQTIQTKLQTIRWMSDATRKKAQSKLKTMELKIGCPQSFPFLEKDIHLRPSAPFIEYLVELRVAKEAMYRQTQFGADKHKWLVPSYIVGASCDSGNTDISLPFALLQPPLFQLWGNKAENYAQLGFPTGLMPMELSLMRMASIHVGGDDFKHFKDRKQVNSSISRLQAVLNTSVNAKKTLNENLADIGGLQLAYHTLQRQYELHGREPIQHGFSPEKRFFIAFAQTMAANMNDDKKLELVHTDPHSPHEIQAPNLARISSCFSCYGGGRGVSCASEKHLSVGYIRMKFGRAVSH